MSELKEYELDLHFGIFADPLEKQLQAYGVTLKNIKKYDLCMESISTLYIHGYLTGSEREKVYKRFLKELRKDIKENLIPIETEAVIDLQDKEECVND